MQAFRKLKIMKIISQLSKQAMKFKNQDIKEKGLKEREEWRGLRSNRIMSPE